MLLGRQFKNIIMHKVQTKDQTEDESMDIDSTNAHS